MPDISIAVRFLHLTASLLPLGLFAFVCLIGQPAAEKAGDAARADFLRFEHRLWRLLAWSLAATFVTGLASFVFQASVMTGLPAAQALTPETFGAVLATQYGKAWLTRQVFLAGLAGVTFLLLRGKPHAGFWRDAGFALAIGLVGSMALTGHAAAGEGVALLLQLGSDALICSPPAHGSAPCCRSRSCLMPAAARKPPGRRPSRRKRRGASPCSASPPSAPCSSPAPIMPGN